MSELYAYPLSTRAQPPSAALLALARARVEDASIFEEHPPFFFTAEASNSNLDAYATHMAESSLKNFAQDAQSGVSLQNSHRTGELGFGRSIAGDYIGPQGNGIARMEATFYSLPGLNLNGVNTSDLIAALKGGVVRDCSVGFYQGRYVCDLCGNAVLSGACRHIPGVEYDVEGGRSAREPVRKLATAAVHDARLAEVSLCYDGATPGCAVTKLHRMVEAGFVPPAQARLLEQRFRSLCLAGSYHTWAGWTPPALVQPTWPPPGAYRAG